MNSPADRLERATARAADAGDVQVHRGPVARRGSDEQPLYSVEDRRCSGEWRVVGEFADPRQAQQVAALLRSAGGIVRVELIPTPIIR